MTGAAPKYIPVGPPEARRLIATLVERPARPSSSTGVVWLPGFRSEMTSTKASALAAWAERERVACTRFDYSGHGQSDGQSAGGAEGRADPRSYTRGTIGAWLDEVDAVFATATTGPQVLVGSSMGGYLALLLLQRYLARAPELAARIHALVLVAPAWDMTERLMWARFPESARRAIAEQGVYFRPSSYGDGPYAITRAFIDEGRNHLIGPQGFDPGRPIHILHGLQDEDVPWEHTLDLVSILTGDQVRVEAVPEGDHRLSTPDDIALLLRTVAAALD